MWVILAKHVNSCLSSFHKVFIMHWLSCGSTACARKKSFFTRLHKFIFLVDLPLFLFQDIILEPAKTHNRYICHQTIYWFSSCKYPECKQNISLIICRPMYSCLGYSNPHFLADLAMISPKYFCDWFVFIYNGEEKSSIYWMARWPTHLPRVLSNVETYVFIPARFVGAVSVVP